MAKKPLIYFEMPKYQVDATAYPDEECSIDDKVKAMRDLKDCCGELGLRCECLGIDKVLVRKASWQQSQLNDCLAKKGIATQWTTQ